MVLGERANDFCATDSSCTVDDGGFGCVFWCVEFWDDLGEFFALLDELDELFVGVVGDVVVVSACAFFGLADVDEGVFLGGLGDFLVGDFGYGFFGEGVVGSGDLFECLFEWGGLAVVFSGILEGFDGVGTCVVHPECADEGRG